MRVLLLTLGLLVAACSAQVAENPAAAASSSAAARHPVSGLEVIPVTVTPPGGQPHALKAEIARSDAEQAQGLMFRTAMGADEGMLFPYDPPRTVSFWMKNTVLSLDLIFIGADRKVINVAARATPYSEASIWSRGPAAAVLELNAGRAAQLGIVPGTRIDW
ncbi:MAG: hypothetical protein B7Z08_01435 [Sphingomonadales bacterium 32-68-7]|nr:MAG: hypothetical protein B7Z33_08770 [Sphingomonadales bacterium 12-68-11]OYX10378.1 MAG: hypothetical protein B7Z08_01435 [Sphingomonadales bacterium 32-68-7]